MENQTLFVPREHAYTINGIVLFINSIYIIIVYEIIKDHNKHICYKFKVYMFLLVYSSLVFDKSSAKRFTFGHCRFISEHFNFDSGQRYKAITSFLFNDVHH